jgi:hypothetical protein
LFAVCQINPKGYKEIPRGEGEGLVADNER